MMDGPTTAEGLLLCDLQGRVQVVNLTEIAQMTDEERKDEDGILYDLRTLLINPRYLRIVVNMPDLLKLGENIALKIEAEHVTALSAWQPQTPRDCWGMLRQAFSIKEAGRVAQVL